MHLLKFEKLRIHYTKVSRFTNLDRRQLFNNIFVELNRPGYIIMEENETSVKFRHNIWRFGSNLNAMSYVDGGRFDIDEQNKMISFSFYYSLAFDIFVNSIVFALIVLVDYQVVFLNIFFLIMGLIRFIRVRQNAVEMLGKIISER